MHDKDFWAYRYIESGCRLSEIDVATQIDIVNDILLAMSATYGKGLSVFFPVDVPAEMVLKQWISALIDCSIKSLYEAMSLVCKGKTEHKKYPPNAIEFYEVYKNINKSISKTPDELGLPKLSYGQAYYTNIDGFMRDFVTPNLLNQTVENQKPKTQEQIMHRRIVDYCSVRATPHRILEAHFYIDDIIGPELMHLRDKALAHISKAQEYFMNHPQSPYRK